MENRIVYQLTIKNDRYCETFSLPETSGTVSFGTAEGCSLQLPLSSTARVFSVMLSFAKTNFRVSASDSICFDAGKKLLDFSMQDACSVYNSETNEPLLTFQVSIEVQRRRKADFSLAVELPIDEVITIGGASDCTVKVRDFAVGTDYITLQRSHNTYFLQTNKSNYGVHVNTRVVGDQQKVQVRNCSFIALNGFQFYLRDGYLYFSIPSCVTCPPSWRTLDAALSKSNLEYPKFNKSTRLLAKPEDSDIQVLDPPAKPEPKKKRLLLQLLPAIVMLALVIVLRGVMGNGGTYVIFSVCSMGMGIVMSIVGGIFDQRDTKEALANRESSYRSYIDRKRSEIKCARVAEKECLETIYRTPEQDVHAVRDFSACLFDRNPEDFDFLHTYLGVGDKPALRKVTCNTRETIDLGDELSLMPDQLCEEYRTITDVPVWTDLAKANVVGVIGGEQKNYALMKNITIDLCTRQFYKDVKLFYVINSDYENHFLWLRWLPHVQNEELGVRNLVCNNESKIKLFEYLYALLAKREQEKVKYPHIIVFIMNDMEMRKHPLARYLKNSSDLGVTFIFFENYAERLPDCCNEIITLTENENSGTLVSKADSRNSTKFTFKPVADEIAQQVALRLAPIYCEEINVGSTLPKNYTFFDCMGIQTADSLEILQYWKRQNTTKSLAVPLGVNARGEKVLLDIHEKAHGPHGLVAGTTGSGKSELIMSYLLALSVYYSPEQVSFLIIDFKGGSTADAFKHLPHLAGMITNMDGRALERSLKSIRAESQRRQRLLKEAGGDHDTVKDIDRYTELYQKGLVKEPLPHLIIVVDEFAELKAAHPDFMKELDSTARTGRSLGIHLILATQKPSGQVNDQVWSNSRFRLCLKVQNKEDSNEMLKSPLAAEIREPGRAYLQVGNNEVFELFQSGYSGGAAEYADTRKQDAFSVAEISLWGKRTVLFKQKNEFKKETGLTQIKAVVNVISRCLATSGIKAARSICLPALSNVIEFPMPQKSNTVCGITAELGMYDDPENQVQDKVEINLSHDNLIIIGSAQTGKTNLLQAIIRNLAERYTSEQVNLYILDFGSLILKNFADLAHVGGVATANEQEKVKNLFKMLLQEISGRKERLLHANVSSFSAYLEAGGTDMPQIVLLLDNFTPFKEVYPNESEQLLTICREGVSVGISVVIANTQTTGFGYKYLSNFAQRIALCCNDTGEYSSLFNRSRLTPENLPGRGLIERDKRILEYQTYLPFGGEREIDRVRNIKAFIKRANTANHGKPAHRIPIVPDFLSRTMLRAEQPELFAQPYQIPYAINYTTMAVEMLRLTQIGILGICGREGMGRTNFLFNILATLNEDAQLHTSQVYIIDDAKKKLQPSSGYSCVMQYTTNAQDVEQIIEAMHEELMARKELVRVSEGSLEDVLCDKPLLMLILSGQDAVTAASGKATVQDKLMAIGKELHEYKSCVIVTGIENAMVSYSAPTILRTIKDTHSLIMFEDVENFRFVDTTLSERREWENEIRAGDAYGYTNGRINKLRTVRNQ